MKITKVKKTFNMTISGGYQSYNFGCELTAEGLDIDLTKTAIEDAPEIKALQKAVVESTMYDIAERAVADPDFNLVLHARAMELEKIREAVIAKQIYEENQKLYQVDPVLPVDQIDTATY